MLKLSFILPLVVFEDEFIFSLDMFVNSRSNLYLHLGGGRDRIKRGGDDRRVLAFSKMPKNSFGVSRSVGGEEEGVWVLGRFACPLSIALLW